MPDNWGDSANTFNSINLNHNWVLGRVEAERVHLPVRRLRQPRSPRARGAPQQTFPNGVTIGYNTNTPQTTEQHKYQFRDDFSWHVTGMGGLGHDFKAGVNFINEPHLYRHVLVGQHRLRLHPPDQRRERPDQPRHAQQARRVGEPADEAVRRLHPGRLAR